MKRWNFAWGFMMVAACQTGFAQTTIEVDNFSDLSTAVSNINSQSDSQVTIQFTADITNDFGDPQMFVNVLADKQLLIDGNGHTLDMGQVDRAFFVAGGDVTFENLTIANGLAKGGNAQGGGGMGAGGAIFVANGQGITGSGITTPTHVALSNVTFQSNQAIGGDGLTGGDGINAGGGGGLGGNGGRDNFTSIDNWTMGGGGGIGRDASGGSGTTPQPGADGVFVADGTQGGGSGSDGTLGGQNGGGGGASIGPANNEQPIAGGGGGIGGQDGQGANGGDGGWGGGGGSATTSGNPAGGNGGFGGGGGTAGAGGSGNGGFGGGGGGGGGIGGFGGGAGGGGGPIAGGGGLGAGGAVFVHKGATISLNNVTFADDDNANTVSSGSGRHSGSAYGPNMFLGSDISVQVNDGETSFISGLGGAGNTADGNNNGDPTQDAQGGLTKTGNGTLVLTGNENWYVGETTIANGTLTLQNGGTTSQQYAIQNGGTFELGVGAMFNAAVTPISLQDDGTLKVSASTMDFTGQSALTAGTVEVAAGSTVQNLAFAQAGDGGTARLKGGGTIDGLSNIVTLTQDADATQGLTISGMVWNAQTQIESKMTGIAIATITDNVSFNNDASTPIEVLISEIASDINVGDEIPILVFDNVGVDDTDLSYFELAGMPSFMTATLDIVPISPGDYSTTQLVVNVQSIPEPGVAVLLSLGFLATCSRRLSRTS